MPIYPSNKPVIAITTGDPSGIGPEVTLKALLRPHIKDLAHYIIVGDLKTLLATAGRFGLCLDSFKFGSGAVTKRIGRTGSVPVADGDLITLLDLDNMQQKKLKFGKESAVYGKASVEYLQKGLELIKEGIAECIVTAPINKAAARKAGFRFPGQTEFFADS